MIETSYFLYCAKINCLEKILRVFGKVNLELTICLKHLFPHVTSTEFAHFLTSYPEKLT